MDKHFTFLLLLLAFVCSVYANSSPSVTGVQPEDIQLSRGNLVIQNGIVVNSDEVLEGYDVIISEAENKVVAVGKNLPVPTGARVIDAKGKYVMPGGIDPHVHMELPFMGTVSADDFYTGTAAALAGGTTMIIDFAIPGPKGSHLEAYESYRKKADAKVAADYALHVGVVDFNDQVAKEMEILTKEKKAVNSYKFFMAYKGVFMVDDEQMFQGFSKAVELGATPMVHAENGELVVQGQKRMIELGITGPEGHGLSRPATVEAEAVHRAATIAERVGSPLYVVHVMSKNAMEEVLRAKLRGLRIVGEPIIGGLILNDSMTYDKDYAVASRYIMSPPLRPGSEGHNEALRNALKNKVLDLVGTDHCVFNTEQKKLGLGDFRKIPNGLNGLEDRMNLLWDLMVKTGEISPSDFVRVTSTEAAQIFNIYPQKGAVKPGSDADVIILDPKATKTISAKTHHQNIDFNVYEGREIQGVVETTISRGKVVYEKGTLKAVKGAGRFVHTPPFGKLFRGLDVENELKRPKGVKRD